MGGPVSGLYGSLNPELFWGGEQAAWWGPMAVAVIAGIIFATFLTLILVPVMYSVVDDATALFKRLFTRGDEEESSEVAEEPVAAEPTPAPVPPGRPREPAVAYRRSPPLGGPELQPE